jgi:2-hydroxychromene-2-carboxylate isomerase
MTSFELSYDYRCPFAKNMHLHVLTALDAGADFSVDFVPWTMSQGYKVDGAPDVWDDPAHDADLLALAVSVSVRDLQPDLFLAAHGALFRARHDQAIRLVSLEEIDRVLTPLGVDMDVVREDLTTRRPHEVIGASFRKYEKVEAFGVPTFVVGNDATFVRYMQAPTDNAKDSIVLIDSIVNLITAQPELNEFKHTRLPQ